MAPHLPPLQTTTAVWLSAAQATRAADVTPHRLRSVAEAGYIATATAGGRIVYAEDHVDWFAQRPTAVASAASPAVVVKVRGGLVDDLVPLSATTHQAAIATVNGVPMWREVMGHHLGFSGIGDQRCYSGWWPTTNVDVVGRALVVCVGGLIVSVHEIVGRADARAVAFSGQQRTRTEMRERFDLAPPTSPMIEAFGSGSNNLNDMMWLATRPGGVVDII